MRIRTLELENFMPYRDRVRLDFTDLSLFAIVGETGSGKSSIVDAICYALYGRIPRIRTENGQRENIISRGAKQFHLALSFDLGGATYEVRRQGTAAREDVQIFKEGEQLKDLIKKRDADHYIEDSLLHMSFDVFTRIIVLPQGQFDRFLKPDTPRARREILISLLDLGIYEEIGRAANGHVLSLQGELAGLQHDLDGLDEQELSDDRLATLAETAAQAEREIAVQREQVRSCELSLAAVQQKVTKGQQLHVLADQLERLRAQQPAMEEQRARRDMAQAMASFATSFADWKRLSDQRSALLERQAQAARGAKDATSTLAAARSEREATEQRIATADFAQQLAALAEKKNRLSDQQGTAARLEEVRKQLQQAAAKRTGLERECRRLTESLDAHGIELQRLQSSLVEAQTQEHEAEERFERARAENAALVVQQSLKPGDVCPVCGQIITALTEHREHKDFEQLRTVRETRHGNTLLVQKALNDREKQAGAAEAQLKALQAQTGTLDGEERTLQEQERQTLQLLLQNPELTAADAQEPVQVLRRQLTALHQKETSIQTAQRALAQQSTEQRKREEEAQKKATLLQTEAAAIEGQLRQAQAQVETLGASLLAQARDHGFDSVEAAASAALPPERIAAMTAALTTFDHDLAVTQGQVELLQKELGAEIPTEADLTQAQQARDSAAATLAAAQERAAQAQQSQKELLAKRTFLVDRRTRQGTVAESIGRYQAIARDFGSKGMMNFVSSGILAQLLVTANDRLRLLSRGRYELLLGEDDQMMVQDAYSASGPRDVTTLSGGETFLASLALALAVKDLLSASVDLDSFFIDEGFGTLDENSVQSVADVLESLRQDGSLVGIITHRADLVERFDMVLEVTSVNGSAHIARREAV